MRGGVRPKLFLLLLLSVARPQRAQACTRESCLQPWVMGGDQLPASFTFCPSVCHILDSEGRPSIQGGALHESICKHYSPLAIKSLGQPASQQKLECLPFSQYRARC